MDSPDAQILDWEAAHPHPSEGAALAAAAKLGISRTTWNMRLLRILDTPDALEQDPLTVYRLKRHLERGMRRRQSDSRRAMGTGMVTQKPRLLPYQRRSPQS